MNVTFTPRIIRAAKQVLARGLPVKSAHLSEAFAACLGFKTHAALLGAFKGAESIDARPDLSIFDNRIRELSGFDENGYATAIMTQALVYAVEFDRARDSDNDTKVNLRNWVVTNGCRELYEARMALLTGSWSDAIQLARYQPVVRMNCGPLRIGEGYLEFDPRAVSKSKAIAGIRRLLEDREGLGPDPIDQSVARPRMLKSFPADLSVCGIISALEKVDDFSPSEVESVQLLSYLTLRYASEGYDPITYASLHVFTGERLPLFAFAVMQSWARSHESHAIPFRGSTSSFIWNGHLCFPQDIPAMERIDKTEAQSIFANTRSKFIMRVEDFLSSSDLPGSGDSGDTEPTGAAPRVD